MKGNGKIEITDGLLIAFINGELDSASVVQVQEWLNKSGENSAHLETIQKAWKVTGALQPQPVVVDTEKAWQNVFDKIEDQNNNVMPLNVHKNRKIYWGIAASIVVLLGVFSVLNFFNGGPESITRFAENAGVVDELSDGSVVTLNANSSIVYPKIFANNERRIALNGEAFFEIKRNEKKPFIIDLPEELYVKVLGTSFNIKAEEGDSLTEVYVKTGKVEFGTSVNHIILVAGEKGVMNHITGEIYTIVHDQSVIKETDWTEASLNFQGTSLTEVIDVLNIVYEDQVILACDEVGDLLLTSEHEKDDPLGEVVSIIATIFELSIGVEELNGQTQFILSCDD